MPTPEEIASVVLRGLCDVARVEEDRLTPDAALEDFDIDSFDMVELGQIVQDRFGVEVDRAAMKGVKTVDEACRALVAQVALVEPDELLRLEWRAPEAHGPAAERAVEFVDADTARDALERVQAWLAGAREGVLAFVTRGAVATVAGEDVTDRAGSAVWGLVRSAQTEHPGRFALV